jgi:hypothetical protein
MGLLSLALSSLRGEEGNVRRRLICSLSRRFISIRGANSFAVLERGGKPSATPLWIAARED